MKHNRKSGACMFGDFEPTNGLRREHAPAGSWYPLGDWDRIGVMMI